MSQEIRTIRIRKEKHLVAQMNLIKVAPKLQNNNANCKQLNLLVLKLCKHPDLISEWKELTVQHRISTRKIAVIF